MKDTPKHTRRGFLTSVSLLVTVLSSGCLGNSDDPGGFEGQFERDVDPSRTYLRTESDNTGDASPIDLGSLGLEPGDEITIERSGSFEGSSGGTGMIAVFSGSDELAPSDSQKRVADAIDAEEDYETSPTYEGGSTTDIPEDFLVADNGGEQKSVTVTVPEGATHLFVAAIDNFYEDNSPGEEGFGVRITLAE